MKPNQKSPDKPGLTGRARRRAYVKKHGLPEEVEHGATAYTNWGCRCDVCRAGHAAECALYKL